MRIQSQTYIQSQDGFSLLETLIALVIMSLASLALFQSSSALLRVSDKALEISETLLDDGAGRKMLRSLIAGAKTHWPENIILGTQDDIFTGDNRILKGRSVGVPTKNRAKFEAFTLELVELGHDNTALRLTSTDLVLDVFPILGRNAKMEYLGEDKIWYKQWPPREIPSPGFFNDVELMQMPHLPLAVKISWIDGIFGEDVQRSIIAATDGATRPPYRDVSDIDL